VTVRESLNVAIERNVKVARSGDAHFALKVVSSRDEPTRTGKLHINSRDQRSTTTFQIQ